MKLGLQDKAKLKWAIGLFAVAVGLAVYNLKPAAEPLLPITAVHKPRTTTKAAFPSNLHGPSFRAELFERGQSVSFESGRNIFRMREEEHSSSSSLETKKIVAPDNDKPKSTTEAVAPIDLKFFGYFRKSGEPKKILVSQGDVIFLAQEGSLVGLRYKILEIKNNSVVVQDVLSNQQQSLILAQ